MRLSNLRFAALGATALAGLTMGFASAAQAALVPAGIIFADGCLADGVFANCYADTAGVHQGAQGGDSPSILKHKSNGNQVIANFPSIDGFEFVVSLDIGTNVLTWSYAQGLGDPDIHFVTIRHPSSLDNTGAGIAYFYDLDAPINGFSVDLDTYFAAGGFSHISFFDGALSQVPEPATLAVFGLGLLGLAASRRRKYAA